MQLSQPRQPLPTSATATPAAADMEEQDCFEHIERIDMMLQGPGQHSTADAPTPNAVPALPAQTAHAHPRREGSHSVCASDPSSQRGGAGTCDVRRASSRPDSPAASLSRPVSGKFRAMSVAGSPRASGGPRASANVGVGFGSHAHARAHQQQQAAVAKAAAAAASSYHTNGAAPHAYHTCCGADGTLLPDGTITLDDDNGSQVGGRTGLGASFQTLAGYMQPSSSHACNPSAGAPPAAPLQQRHTSHSVLLNGGGFCGTPATTGSCTGDRLEIMSSVGSRPSTSESDVSARGSKLSEAKEVRTSAGAHAHCMRTFGLHPGSPFPPKLIKSLERVPVPLPTRVRPCICVPRRRILLEHRSSTS